MSDKHIGNNPTRTPLGAVVQSWWNADAFGERYKTTEPAYFMPMVFQCYPPAYTGAGGIADWNTDYARWMAIIADLDDNYFWYGDEGTRLSSYKVFGVNYTPVDVNPPFNSVTIPNWLTWSANAKTWYRFLDWGLGGVPVTVDIDDLKVCYYRINGGNQYDVLPKRVSVYIQNGGNMSKADMEPGITDFYAWLDDRGQEYDETLDATGRWLNWLCDYYESF